MFSSSTAEIVRDKIYRIARRRVPRDADAEDLTQKVMVVMVRKYADIPESEVFLAACGILRRTVQKFWTITETHGESSAVPADDTFLSPAADPETLMASEEDRRAREAQIARMTEALKAIKEPCRTIFRMKFQGVPTAEIRDAIRTGNEKENNIYLVYSRCKAHLRDMMGGSLGATA